MINTNINMTLTLRPSGFGGLVVSMLASGTQDRGFEPSGLGGLRVCMLASGTQDRGFAPDQSRRIFPAGKIHSMPSFVQYQNNTRTTKYTIRTNIKKNPRPKSSEFLGEKIHSMPSFGEEVKPFVPYRRFEACKRSLRFTWKSESQAKLTGLLSPNPSFTNRGLSCHLTGEPLEMTGGTKGGAQRARTLMA
jgi:hypothetical protein